MLTLAPVALALALYLTTAIVFVQAMLRRDRRSPTLTRAPLVTIFKPLAGIDDDLEDNLASFAALDYPAFEILFGAASVSDPALAAARAFLARHPRVRARIVLSDPDAALNPKVAQLISLEPHAQGEVFVISDSNVRVRPAYLTTLVAELEDPRVGLVTSIFAGTGEQTLGAALENLQLGAIVTPGIVAYNRVSSSPLTLGKSMAMRRADLRAVGGFRRVGGVLAEDHALGCLLRGAGLEVRTSLAPVENRNCRGGIGRTIERHTRWAKMRRAIAPLPFLFEPILSPVATATLMLAIAPTRAQLAALLAAALIQSLLGFVSVRILRGTTLAWHYAPLEIFRAYVALGCWALAFASRRVEWRGHAFILGAGSALRPVRRSPRAPGAHARESVGRVPARAFQAR